MGKLMYAILEQRRFWPLYDYEIPPNMQENEELKLSLSVEVVGFVSQSINSNLCATGGVHSVLMIWNFSIDEQCGWRVFVFQLYR